MTINAVNEQTVAAWASFASQVWQTDVQLLLKKWKNHEFPFEFLFHSQSGEAVAWISLSIRKEYVEGCQGGPVAYLEGIFVSPSYRQQGVAEELVDFAVNWARN